MQRCEYGSGSSVMIALFDRLWAKFQFGYIDDWGDDYVYGLIKADEMNGWLRELTVWGDPNKPLPTSGTTIILTYKV